MKRYDLKNGMFGKMSDGKLFVIVNDLVVYQNGGYDHLTSLTSELSYSYYEIDCLVDALSFNDAEVSINKGIDIIWRRNSPEKIPTMMEVFFERNPNAPLDGDGTPHMCPKGIDEDWSNLDCVGGSYSCTECWNRTVPNTKEGI